MFRIKGILILNQFCTKYTIAFLALFYNLIHLYSYAVLVIFYPRHTWIDCNIFSYTQKPTYKKDRLIPDSEIFLFTYSYEWVNKKEVGKLETLICVGVGFYFTKLLTRSCFVRIRESALITRSMSDFLVFRPREIRRLPSCSL